MTASSQRGRAFPGHFLFALVLTLSAPAFAGTFDDRKPECMKCHGDNGTSPTAETPSLGGQPEDYVLFQLVAFREGERKVPVMNDMMKGMSDDDLRAASAWIASLPKTAPAAEPADAERMKRGAALADKHRCGFCHQADFAGHDSIPRIRNQREDYLIKALRDYKGQKRYGSRAAMNEVVYPLNDSELADLAYFVARMK